MKVMNRRIILGGVLLLGAAMTVPGARVGGNAEVVYESINAGGASFASALSGSVKLGGSLAQNGWIALRTNGADLVSMDGFWKADGPCADCPPVFTNMVMSGASIALTFTMINSNRYRVLYVTEEEGGLLAGTHAFTNVLAELIGQGWAGSSTTVWHDVAAATNNAAFYLIRCSD